MAKARSQFICQQCGASFSKWAGRCENCGEWNSLVEQVVSSGGSSVVDKSTGRGKVLKTSSIREAVSESGLERLSTGIDDLDVVLGGGFLVGGVVLVAGLARNWKKYAAGASCGTYRQDKIGVICKR